MIKSLIVGCGKIAGIADDGEGSPISHASSYREDTGVTLAGCVDINFEKAQKFGEQHFCKPFGTIYEALKEVRPEIVSLCTPDKTHYAIAKELLESEHPPKVIFLEKPACRSQSELDELIVLSVRRKVEIVVNHTRRFDFTHRVLKRRIEEGEFGQFYRANVVYYGGWQHNGVHIVDTLSLLLNDSLKVVSISDAEAGQYEGDPTLGLELSFRHNPGRVLLSGVNENLYQIFDFDLWFTNARLRIEDFGSRVIIQRKTVNSIGENVLLLENTPLQVATESAIQFAIKLLINYLTIGDSSLLVGYRLSDSVETYQTLWDGVSFYEQLKRKGLHL